MKLKAELAREGRDGLVWVCDQCEDVHVRWQNCTLTLTRAQFAAFSRMAEAAGRAMEPVPSAAPPAGTADNSGTSWLQ